MKQNNFCHCALVSILLRKRTSFATELWLYLTTK